MIYRLTGTKYLTGIDSMNLLVSENTQNARLLIIFTARLDANLVK